MKDCIFNSYEHVLLARYHFDIRMNHKDSWLQLSTRERSYIQRSRAQQHGKPTAGRPFWSDQDLLPFCDTQKLISVFPILSEKLGIMPKTDLYTILRDAALNEPEFVWLAVLVRSMNEAGDSNISFSNGNIGVNIIRDTIDIVDIDAGKSIATIKLTINN